MLASISQMETAQSLPRNPDALMKQPSAEDLDAAQQLISSAQAGREHSVDRHRDDGAVRKVESDYNNATDASTVHSTETSRQEATGEKTSGKSQRDTSFLGHSCRLVFSWISSFT